MNIFLMLLLLCVISIFIPHKDKKYNFSWHFRLLSTITLMYFIGWYLHKLITI
jgi:hypothetical protein